MGSVTMVAANLSTIELNSLNNEIFSAISRIKNILKQLSDVSRVLNEVQKSQSIYFRKQDDSNS